VTDFLRLSSVRVESWVGLTSLRFGIVLWLALMVQFPDSVNETLSNTSDSFGSSVMLAHSKIRALESEVNTLAETQKGNMLF